MAQDSMVFFPWVKSCSPIRNICLSFCLLGHNLGIVSSGMPERAVPSNSNSVSALPNSKTLGGGGGQLTGAPGQILDCKNERSLSLCLPMQYPVYHTSMLNS